MTNTWSALVVPVETFYRLIYLRHRHGLSYEVDKAWLESQWIPTDPDIWKVSRHREFLEARRQLLAKAANQFLEAIADLAWPNGLQAHLTAPVALLLVQPEGAREALEKLGYKVFTTSEALKAYLEEQLETAAD